MKKKNYPILARGIALNMLSYSLFILLNYGLHIFLARNLGVVKYGHFGIVMSIVVIINTFLFKAMMEAEAKIVSTSTENRFSVLLSSLNIQILLSGIVTLIIISGSSLLGNLLHIPSISNSIIAGSLSIIPWSIFASYMGIVVGLRRFGLQSILMSMHAIVKTVFIISAVLLGLGVTGAFTGYSLSIIPGLIVVIIVIGINISHKRYPIHSFIKLLIPLSIISLLCILLQSIDLLLVQVLLFNEGKTGIYTSAQTVAKLLPIVFTSFSTTILPSISMSLEKNNINQFRLYVHQAMRYLFLLISPLVAIVAAFSEKISVFLFSIVYKDAGTPLAILMVSMALLSILLVSSAIVIGSGNGWAACKLLSVTLVVVGISDLIFIPRFELVGAASASACGFLFGCILFYLYISKKWGHFIDFFPLCMMIGIALLFYAIAKYLPISGNLWLFVGPVLFLSYFIILISFRVLNKEDMKVIKNIFHIN